MTLTKEELVAAFNEWNRRYAEDPESFMKIIDDEGKPLQDINYGECCATFFTQIVDDLFAAKGEGVIK
jgi:hypothetical protein